MQEEVRERLRLRGIDLNKHGEFREDYKEYSIAPSGVISWMPWKDLYGKWHPSIDLTKNDYDTGLGFHLSKGADHISFDSKGVHSNHLQPLHEDEMLRRIGLYEGLNRHNQRLVQGFVKHLAKVQGLQEGNQPFSMPPRAKRHDKRLAKRINPYARRPGGG